MHFLKFFAVKLTHLTIVHVQQKKKTLDIDFALCVKMTKIEKNWFLSNIKFC